MRGLAWTVFAALAFFVGGCSRNPGPAPRIVVEPLPADPWILATNDPEALETAWLSNGLIGLRLGRNATGYGANGTPLPFFHAEEYDATGEEKIRPLPSPMLVLMDEASNFMFASDEPREVQDYRQELDMRTGILVTSWTEAIAKGRAKVVAETVLHPVDRIVSQRWTVTGDRDADFTIGWASGELQPKTLGKNDQLYVEERLGPSKVKFAVRQRLMTDAEPFRVLTKKGEPYRVEITWSFGRSPQIQEVSNNPVVQPSGLEPLPPPTYDEVAIASKGIWAKRWKTDIVIDGPVEDQRAVRSFLFYLQASVHPEAPVAVPPLALSNAQYNGHVFWDADLWVFPALALINPKAAKAIPDYRIKMADQARRNYQSWLQAGRPTAEGKVTGGKPSPTGHMYPWESSVTGKETVPGPSRWQHHITGSVVWGLDQARSFGIADESAVENIGKGARQFFLSRSECSQEECEIRGTMSPDEHHIGDNDLFTNLLAEWVEGRFAPLKSQEVAFKRPRDETSLLTYDDDPVRGYKQAAAVLAIYPLQDPEAERQAKTMMERFSDKVTPNGPAMSESAHATIWARIGEKEKAYTSWRKSWTDFSNHPLLLFSEKRKKAVTYFVTGAGGSLQSVIYGFLGFRIDSKADRTAKWSSKLRGERWLNVRPNLPKAWKSVQFRNFHVLGRSYTLTVTPTTTQVTQGE